MPCASLPVPRLGDLDRWLLQAAERGHFQEAAVLLDRGALLEAHDDLGQTALHLASNRGHVETARLLLDRGAAIEASDVTGWTPLHRASFRGSVKMVHLLSSRGAWVDARCHKQETALHLAVSWSQADTIMALIEQGADLDARNAHRHTPLNLAIAGGNTGVVKILLASGANVDHCEEPVIERARQAPRMGRLLQLDRLCIAAESGRLDLLRATVKALSSKHSCEEWDPQMRLAIHHAAEDDRFEAVAFLQACLAASALDAACDNVVSVRPL